MDPRLKLVLEVLRVIAKVLPFLSKAVLRITDVLLSESRTTGEIVHRKLEDSSSVQPSSKSAHRSIAATDATEETHRSEEPASQVSAVPIIANAESPSEPPSKTSLAAQEMSLRQIQVDFEDNRQRMQKRLDRIQAQDSAVFRAMLFSGAASVVLILWGAYSLLVSGINVVAVLAEVVGLLAGAGTAILRALQKGLRDKSTRLERQEEEQTRYLRAIQSALALTGPEREKQLVETARWLRDSVGEASQQPAAGDAGQNRRA